jgi:hypothetical protein
MALKIKYIKDGQNKVIGSVTSGYAGDTSIARDEHGSVLGQSSDLFHTTRERDSGGSLVSIDTSDAGLLFRKK